MEHRDDIGAKLGMWIFLFTEIFFFGGLFLVYAVYRAIHPVQFHEASLHLNTFVGGLNSAILLVSSFTIAMGVTWVQRGNNKIANRYIALTLLLAVIFLINKYFEWDHKILLNLYPGSELMLSLKHGYILYFGLYYFMTGLHALHILVGIILLTICWLKVSANTLSINKPSLLINTALYWHLVDLVWIFLFPLLYLIP